MLKLTVAVLALALAGTASADPSSSLRVDASSDAAFKQSLAVFKDDLSPEQRQAFGDALKDIWIVGTQAAENTGGKYREADYYREIDGLTYDDVVALTTGESAKLRLQAAAAPPRAAPRRPAPPPYVVRSPWEGVPPPIPATPTQPRGGPPLFGPGPGNQ